MTITAQGESPALAGCTDAECLCARSFAACLVKTSAAVLAGVKPASLFSFCEPADAEPSCARCVTRAFACSLARVGLKLAVLFRANGRTGFLLYWEHMVDELLASVENRAFLAALGYEPASPRELISALRERLCAYHEPGKRRREYPHEVGLILGYPLEDVRGFMEGGLSETCRGPWRVYGDRQAAERRFDVLKAHERSCRERFENGASLADLLASA